MSTSRPPQPQVMELIQERRERLGMSIRGAAALAVISEARWRQLESGGRTIRGTWIAEDAPEPTLARMALAVRMSPSDIEPYSERAAKILAALAEERQANSSQDADDAARMVDALGGRDLTGRQRENLESEVAEILRRYRNG